MAAKQSFSAKARAVVAAMMGVSALQAASAAKTGYAGVLLEDASVEQIREAMGGQIQPLPNTKTRWYLQDLEIAQRVADSGDLLNAAQLYRAMRRDGVIAGLLGTRTAGLVRLPKKFYGDPEIADALAANNGSRSIFDEMFPPAELAALAADGVVLGVGVAEMVPVEGREYPVMVRLNPENLFYLWTRNAWYFKSVAGLIEIHPGDGRWILHLPGARMEPWNAGLWPSLGRSYINKEHAMSCRSNYSAKLANPARVAFAPLGASEIERKNFFKRLMAWGLNTVFDLPPGWDVKLIESNGIGIKIFQSEIDTSNEEIMVAITGNTVSTTGGTGFISSAIFKAIRQDLIKSDADALAYTINTQGLPIYLVTSYGLDALETRLTTVQWDASTPVELSTEAQSYATVGGAIKALTEAVQAAGGASRGIDVDALLVKFGIPLQLPANYAGGNVPINTATTTAATFETQAQAIASLVSRLPANVRRLPLDTIASLLKRAA